MALEALVFQQDPFNYGCKEFNYNMGDYGFYLPTLEEEKATPENLYFNGEHVSSNGYWDSPPSSVAQHTTSSSETCGGGSAGDGFVSRGRYSKAAVPLVAETRWKRRRTKPFSIDEVDFRNELYFVSISAFSFLRNSGESVLSARHDLPHRKYPD